MQGFLLSCLYSLVGCVGFCIGYNLRGWIIPVSALGGAIGWAVFQLFAFTGNDIGQYFLATIALSVYSEIMARIFKTPVTVFLIVALIPLVPGGGIYYTMEYCINGNISMFIQEGIHTIFITGALAIGILVVSALVRIIRRIRETPRLGGTNRSI